MPSSGAWEDDEVVVTTLERTGQIRPYSDVSDVPLVSYNPAFERRQNVRFELGMQSGKLADLRASRMRINPDSEKRAALEKFFNANANIMSGPVIAELEKCGISYKNGETYLLPGEILKRTY